MNTAITRSSTTMVIIGVITWTVLISMTTSAPLTLATREIPSDHPQVLLWLDQSVPELQNEMFEWSNNPALTRTKRIGSLSIVNSLDVLRQRVLLELARRKALQDQRQIDANRRFLDTIGKRSASMYNREISKNSISPKVKNGLEYSGRTQDWFEENEPDFREGEDDQIRRVRISLVDRFL